MTRLEIRVQPGASRNGFAGWYGDIAKLRVSAAPVDGAANDAVVEVLAELLGVRPRQIALVSGLSSRTKVLEIDQITAEELRDRLDVLNPARS
ncbi:MAG TPA: DUF167 domain-containing protein [Ilumatobacter sp.]|nr:DUF167 domain-containing protein [Ilumatobacter sp.]